MSKRIDESSNPQSNLRGTIYYIYPKKLNDSQPYSLNEKSDVYSVGVLLWEISSGQPPFKDCSRYYLIMHIPQGLREKAVSNSPDNYVKIYTGKYNI